MVRDSLHRVIINLVIFQILPHEGVFQSPELQEIEKKKKNIASGKEEGSLVLAGEI